MVVTRHRLGVDYWAAISYRLGLIALSRLGGVQCSQPSSPSVFGGGRDGLPLVVRLFGGARTDYAREGKDRTDYGGL